MTTIYNVPAYAKNYPLIAAREVDGSYWFFGAYNCDQPQVAEAASDGYTIFITERVALNAGCPN